MTYNASPTIPDTPENPDTPASSNKGSLVVEKLDYQTKKKVAEDVYKRQAIYRCGWYG